MPYDQIGKLLIIFGVLIAGVGVLFFLFGRTQLGRLPGDINISTGSFTCVVPIVSMLLLSLLLTIVVNVVLRLFNR